MSQGTTALSIVESAKLENHEVVIAAGRKGEKLIQLELELPEQP